MAKTRDVYLAEKERYKEFLEERRILIHGQREESRTFEKAILTFASAAVVISAQYLDRVVPEQDPDTNWLLGLAWAAIGISIISILSSFITSSKAHERQFDVSQAMIMKNKTISNRWTTATVTLNFLSVLLIAVAMVFGGIFVYRNRINPPLKSPITTESPMMLSPDNLPSKPDDPKPPPNPTEPDPIPGRGNPPPPPPPGPGRK